MMNRAPKKITNAKAEMAQNILLFIGFITGFVAIFAFTKGAFVGMLIFGGLSLGAFRWGASIKTTYRAKSQTTRYE